MLRYDSPVQLTSRTATEDVEVGGSVIGSGRSVIVFIGGANRDPEVFEQPDRFRIDRPDPHRHLSFSLGIQLPRRLAGPAGGPHRHRRADPAVSGS
jgi:cytochrome P450